MWDLVWAVTPFALSMTAIAGAQQCHGGGNAPPISAWRAPLPQILGLHLGPGVDDPR